MTSVLPGLQRYESSGAKFDADRIYRYSLHRMWGGGSLSEWKTTLWIMLNPSTADEHVLDPTLRRVEGFSRRWGYDGFEVANLFAYRATQPDNLWKESLCGMDVVGPENDDHVLQAAKRADRIIVGWGRHAVAPMRARKVLSLLSRYELWCLGINQDASPKHPLYLANATELVRFREAA